MEGNQCGTVINCKDDSLILNVETVFQCSSKTGGGGDEPVFIADNYGFRA